MVVFSLVGTNVVGLSGFVYIFLLSQQHHFNPAGQSVLGISFCHLTPCVHTTFPSISLYLCVSFVLSYLFSAKMAICVILHLLFPGQCREDLLNSCAHWGPAFVIFISLWRKKDFLLHFLNPDLTASLFFPVSKCFAAVSSLQQF